MAGDGSGDVVGRDPELSLLDRACEAGRGGQGSAICLTGPAGIGKTTLVHVARERARQRGMRTASTWCWAEGAPPLWPWLDVLAQLDLMQDAGDIAAQGFRGFPIVEHALATMASSRPLWIAVDDLHHADEATKLITRYLAARISESSVVLLHTHRPIDMTSDGNDRVMAEIDRVCDTMALQPLPPADIAELARTRGYDELSPDVAAALTAASGGIPLHAVAALQAWAADTTATPPTVKLRAHVVSRLGDISADDAAIVARAAVLGQVVGVDLVAAACGTTPSRVLSAVGAARDRNLLRVSDPRVVDFGHDLLREAAEQWLDADVVAATHAAAADLYDPDSSSPEADVVRAARHAVQAARRSPAAAARAVDLGCRAAQVLANGGAPEDAATLLGQAVTANDLAGRPTSRALLLLELAHAVLLSGRLNAAHDSYGDAVAAALEEGLPVIVAEAAAGLGSLWVNTVRSPTAQRRVLRTQRQALARLPAGHTELRLRLRGRIAAEAMFWETAGPDALLGVLRDLGQLDEPATILDVLSVAHNPLLGPQHNELRLRMSEDMLRASAAVPGGILPLMALCWRTVDLFLAGDQHAERALADLRDAAEAMQNLSVLYVVRLLEVMLLINRGRFEQAERAAQAAFELGTQTQDADAISYLGGHLVAIRWFQGHEQDMLDLMQHIATSAHVDVVDHSFEAGIAALAARTGQDDLARQHLNRVKGAGLHQLPRFSTWLMTLATVVEAASALQDRTTMSEAYELLEPFGDLPVAPSLAIVSFGCVHHWLATAAAATGRPTVAEDHFRAAINTNIALGHLPATLVARAALANLLTTHQPTPTREAEARLLLTTALEGAKALGMDDVAARWEATANRLDRRRHVQIREAETGSGQVWIVDFAEHQATVRDLAGMRMLAQLTASPGQWIAASRLAFEHPPLPHAAPDSLLDPTARRALEAQVRKLGDAVAEAREAGDLAAQAAREQDMDAIAEHLAAGTGLAGRERRFADETERARTAVRKAIVRAIKEIERHHPAAAQHLTANVVTGAECRYQG
ncbi:ATP-binding protein [Amycolatopsis sp. NPDC024027]|uniref:ATP-binding protein n=1 Tax=Amycolatopsis sp. NPDC024027 TaxID=3154327 RepID=UPI0033FA7788